MSRLRISTSTMRPRRAVTMHHAVLICRSASRAGIAIIRKDRMTGRLATHAYSGAAVELCPWSAAVVADASLPMPTAAAPWSCAHGRLACIGWHDVID